MNNKYFFSHRGHTVISTILYKNASFFFNSDCLVTGHLNSPRAHRLQQLAAILLFQRVGQNASSSSGLEESWLEAWSVLKWRGLCSV